MSEEQVQPTGATEAPTGGQPLSVAESTSEPTPTVEAPAAVEPPSWRELLDKVDPTELRRHPRFAGIVGSEVDRRLRERETQFQEEARLRARDEQEDEFARLLSENEDVLGEKYPKVRQALIERQQTRQEELLKRQVGESMASFANRIGQSIVSIPEWAELTPDERASLGQAIQGQPDEASQLEAFQRTAVSLLAEKKAAKLAAARFQAELEKARAALRQEIAAEMLSGTPAPDTRRPGGLPSKIAEIRAMSDEDLEREWQRHKESLRR